MPNKNSSTQNGFTLYEIIIYLAIFSMWLLFIIPTVINCIESINNQKLASFDDMDLNFVLQKTDYLFKTLKPSALSAKDTVLYLTDGIATTTLTVSQGDFFITGSSSGSYLTHLANPVSNFQVETVERQGVQNAGQQNVDTTINFIYKNQAYNYLYVSSP